MSSDELQIHHEFDSSPELFCRLWEGKQTFTVAKLGQSIHVGENILYKEKFPEFGYTGRIIVVEVVGTHTPSDLGNVLYKGVVALSILFREKSGTPECPTRATKATKWIKDLHKKGYFKAGHD